MGNPKSDDRPETVHAESMLCPACNTLLTLTGPPDGGLLTATCPADGTLVEAVPNKSTWHAAGQSEVTVVPLQKGVHELHDGFGR